MLFLICEKGMCKKAAPGSLRFVCMLFLIFGKEMNRKIAFSIFEKGKSKKIAQRSLRFVNILF